MSQQQSRDTALCTPQCCDTMVTSPPKKAVKGEQASSPQWLWFLPSAVMSHHIPCAVILSQIPSDLTLQN